MATVTSLGRTHTTTAGNKTFTGNSVTGDLIVVVTVSTGVATSAVSDNDGGTYTQVGTTRTGFSTSGNLQMWVRDSLVSSGKSTIYTATQSGSTGGGLQVLRVTGVTVVGSAAARSTGGQSSGTAGTTPAPVLSNTPLSHNVIIAAVANGTNGSTTVTERSGYTEAGDSGYNTPATGFEVCFRNSGETSATLTFGSTTATAFASYGIELIANRTLTADAGSYSFTGNSANLKVGRKINIPSVSTYYFDASDGGPTDTDSAWTGDANAFDGSISTVATSSDGTGSTSSKFLLGQGTNAPGSGDTITQVRARIHSTVANGSALKGAIYTDGLAELLGTVQGGSVNYGSYVTLSTPSGGWTWTKVQALEIKIYDDASDFGVTVSRAEIEVTAGSVGIFNLTGNSATLSKNSPPTVALNSPADAATSISTTPTLNFTGTDANSDSVEYNVQISTLAGRTTSGASSFLLCSISSDDYILRKFVFTKTVTITKVSASIYRDSSNNSTLAAVIFADPMDSNPFGDELFSSLFREAANTTATFEDFTFTSTATLSAGTYWIGLVGSFQGFGQTYVMYDTGGETNGSASRTSDLNPAPAYNSNNNSINITYTVVDKVSETDSGFTAGHPFASGVAKDFTVQSGDELDNSTTYYWRVRAKDPSGTNSYGTWSSTRSFTTAAAAQVLTASSGSYSLTGNSATLRKSYVLVASNGSYALTGNSATLRKTYRLTADSGTLSLTGNTVATRKTYNLVAQSTSYIFTGNNATLRRTHILTANAGSYTLTGNNVGSREDGRLITNGGSFVLTGNSVVLSRTYRLVAESASFSLSGNTVTLNKGNRLTANSGSYSLTGNDATLTAIDNKSIVADSGTFTLTGNSVSLSRTYRLVAEAGSYILSGTDAGSREDERLVAEAGAYSWTGNSVSTLRTYKLVADSASYSLTGNDATLTAANAETLVAGSGVYNLTGNNVNLVRSYILNTEAGVLSLTGNNVGLNIGSSVVTYSATLYKPLGTSDWVV